MRLVLSLLTVLSVLSAESGLLSVQWPKPNTKQEKSMKSYPTVLIKGIQEVTLPVYLPRYYVYEKDMSVVADKNFYSITIFLEGASLLITGDRTYQQRVKSGGKQLKRMMKAVSSKLIRSEGMMSTDFNRHGVNYSLVVECDLPDTDKRCTEESFLRRVYHGLIIVGGKR